MAPLPEDAAIEAILRLLKWNPRITLSCAREKTGWTGDTIKVLVAKRSDILGILTIRGYTWVCTAAERQATSPKGVSRQPRVR